MSLKKQIHDRIGNSWISGGDLERLSFPQKKGGVAKPGSINRALRLMSAQDRFTGEILEREYPLFKRIKTIGNTKFIQYSKTPEEQFYLKRSIHTTQPLKDNHSAKYHQIQEDIANAKLQTSLSI